MSILLLWKREFADKSHPCKYNSEMIKILIHAFAAVELKPIFSNIPRILRD